MSRSPVLEKAYAEERAYLATVERLARLESPTNDKAACDAVADALADLLTGDGWTVKRHARAAVGDIVEARLYGQAEVDPVGRGVADAQGSETATLLLAHYDTVWPIG